MELIGPTQELLRVLIHAPSGKPQFLGSAIRRSAAVALLGLRGMRAHRLALRYVTLGAFLLLGWALSRQTFNTANDALSSLGLPTKLLLQNLYALVFWVATTSLWLKWNSSDPVE